MADTPDDLPGEWAEFFGGMWNDRARDIWTDFDDYTETLASGKFQSLASQSSDFDEAIRADSDFSAAYAEWMYSGFNDNTDAFFEMLVELGHFDSVDDARDHYGIAA